MTGKHNTRQLVLRRDTATGLALVGWDTELPLGRFDHLALIGKSVNSTLPNCGSEFFEAYQAALHYARQANNRLLEQQAQQLQSKGWVRVPFKLAKNPQLMLADCVGNYAAAAMQLHYQLTQNSKSAWAIIQQDNVLHVRARYPKNELDELTYQVWHHKQLNELNQMLGTLFEGNLIACESGLWFEVN